MGRLDDAVPYHRAVLEGRRRLLGSDHPSTLIGLGDLGYLLCSMGELKLGIPYSEEALSRSRRVLGDRHPETLICFADMGKAMWSLGDYGAAAEHFELHVSGCETTFGATHFETLGAIDWLALVYLRDHRAAAARELLERALHRTRADHGESHECSITLRERLIECYCMLHDQNPEGGFDELVEGLKRAQPED
jgi:hypothetical protein